MQTTPLDRRVSTRRRTSPRLVRDGFVVVTGRRMNSETGKMNQTYRALENPVTAPQPKKPSTSHPKTKSVFVFNKTQKPTIDDLFVHFADAPMMMDQIFIENIFVTENEVAIELSYKKEATVGAA